MTLTMEAFLQKARQVHGDRYNYEKVVYVNGRTKVTITCLQHGDFLIRLSCHTNQKQGCASCARHSRVDTKECLLRLKAVFGDRYGYDKVIYKDKKSPLTLICKDHGDFSRTPQYIIFKGLGCPCCGEEGNGIPWSTGPKKERMSKDNFLAFAREVHGDKYNYDRTKYEFALNKVVITCPKHGDFEQTPSAHISGHGCHECAGTKLMTTSSFIEKALIKNPGKPYDYSSVLYRDTNTPVTITCRMHGPFQVQPNKHLARGDGCTKCNGNYSRQSIAWLEYVAKQESIEIQHAEKGGEKAIILNGRTYHVDGFCEATNTVYQYHGALFHGDPNKYKADDINPLNGKSFGELYAKTIEIENLIARSYNLVVMWETEWLATCKRLGIDSTASCTDPDFKRKTEEDKRQYHRDWREKHRTEPKRIKKTEEEIRQRQKQWREKNRARLQESATAYYQENRTKILAYQKDRKAALKKRSISTTSNEVSAQT